jgi:hypothetical protein
MQKTIEISKPLVAALRMSEALPETQEVGSGNLHLLYGDHFRPVGYMVEKICVDDAWESNDPRFFITTSHAEAVKLLGVSFKELPQQKTDAVTA